MLNEGKRLRRNEVATLFCAVVLFSLFSFEGIALDVLGRLNLPVDIRFWSMGVSAASLYLAGCAFSALMIRATGLRNSGIGTLLFTTVILLSTYFVQAHRRTYFAPFWDDLSAVFEWLPGYLHAGSVGDRLRTLFASYWECKTPVSRMTSVILVNLTGKWFLITNKYLNGSLLVFLSWLLSIQMQSPVKRGFAFLFTLTLLLSFQHFHTALCAFSGTTYYLCLIFGVLAFHFKAKKGYSSLLLTLLFGALSALTFGNGWIVLPLIAFIYALNGEWKRTLISMAVTLSLAAVYFDGYHPERLSDISHFSFSAFTTYFFLFLGNHGQFLYSKAITIVFATFPLITAAYFTLTGKQYKNPSILLCLLIFMIATAVMASAFRHQLGPAQALSVRYGFYSVTAFILSVLLFVDRMDESSFHSHKKQFIHGAIVMTALKLLLFYPEMAIGQEETREMLVDWKTKGLTVPDHTPFYIRGATEILQQAEQEGFWKLFPGDTAVANNNLFTIRYITESNRWRKK